MVGTEINCIYVRGESLRKAISSFPQNMTIGLLFSGERINCVEEGIAIVNGAGIVGLATCTPQGEQCKGMTSIVGFYILPDYRGQGYGKKLLIATIERCQERGWKQVKIDAVSVGMIRVVQSLANEYQNVLQVTDWSMCYIPLE